MTLKPFLSKQEGFTTLKPIPPEYPQHPFYCCIIGPSRSGKSVLARSLLKEVYEPAFDYIFLFSQSLDVNNDFEEFPDIIGHNSFDQNEILEILTDQKEIVKAGKKDKSMKDIPAVLILLDDIADCSAFCNSKVLRMLAYRGRHLSISVMILSQKKSSIPRGCRLNCTHEMIYRCSNGSELDYVLNESVPRAKRKKFFEIMEDVYADPFSFIYFDHLCKDSKKRIKKGFHEVINI